MKRVGIIIPAITDLLRSELIKSVYESAFPLGYDIIVLTNATNAHNDFVYNEYTIGEENIYSLITHAAFDGVIFASQYFYKTALKQRIAAAIRKGGIPCVEIGESDSGFETIHIHSKQVMHDITEHLITVHGCRRLCCLTGPQHIPEARERLYGFLEAAQQHHICIPKENIIYGDYWKLSGKQLGKAILSGTYEKPDAVVCTNDMMAVSLCDTLAAGGMSVPEDILVTGYDAHIEALLHFPSITTVGGQSKEAGRLAFEKLFSMIEGKSLTNETIRLKIIYGASCGCVDKVENYRQAAEQVQTYIRSESHKAEMLEMQTNTSFIASMSEAQSLEELMRAADNTAHIITEHTSINICICSDWKGDLSYPEAYRSEGYSNEMYLALSKRVGANLEAGYYFPIKKLLPTLDEPHTPQLLYVTPIHSILRVLGYCVISYREGYQFQITPLLVSWLDAVANGLRTLQKKRYTDHLHEKIEETSLHDVMTGLLSRKGLLLQLTEIVATGKCCGLLLITIGRMLAANLNNAADGYTMIQAEMLIANALQLMSNTTMQAARIDETHFAFLFPLAEHDRLDAVSEHLITKIDVFLRKMQESTAYAYLPELVYERGIVADSPKEFLAEQITLLDKKAAETTGRRTADAGQLERLRRELHLAPQLDWTMSGMAKQLGISVSYLQKLYGRVFGIGFMDDLIAARIEKAKQLLTMSDLRVNEVAEQCGYQNSTHFMRQFKGKIGVTPSQYRERKKNKSILSLDASLSVEYEEPELSILDHSQ